MKKLMICVLVGALYVFPTFSFAAEEDMSNEEIAKASQNPITMIYSLPIQNNMAIGIGPDDEVKNTANFQPVVPMTLNDDWDIVFRLIMPITTLPGTPIGAGRYQGAAQTGLGDTTLTAFLAPKSTGKVIWGAGGVLYMPTATEDSLKSRQWGAGPSVVALTMQGKWTYGALLMNVWSFSGAGNRTRIDFLQLQPFVNYNLGDGWFLTSVPIIIATWDKPAKERWTVPLGGGFGKGFKLGRLPVSATAQAYYNVVTPDTYGETWQVRLQAQLFFPRKGS